MSSKKRKSSASQQTISKFFKPSIEKKSQKKLPIIHILDDDNSHCSSTSKKCYNSTTIDVEQKQEVLTSGNTRPLVVKNNDNIEKNVCKSINKSINKLKRFDKDNEVTVKNVKCSDFTKIYTSSEPFVENDTENTNSSHFPNVQDFICSYDNSSLEHSNDSKQTSTKQKVINSSQKLTYTPLEQQVMKIKAEHEDVLLFVECGYKFRFFGEDAEIASKELNIYCHLNHNFMTASIPVHRLNVHVSRLVEKGYKVGVVNQTETAALKAAGDNRNTPFTRKLTKIYTKATFIDRDDCDEPSKSTPGNYMVCIYVKKNPEFITALLLVNVLTGDIVYDIINDEESLLSRLDTIFYVLKPCEIILEESFKHERIQKFIHSYKHSSSHSIRIEFVKVIDEASCSYKELSKNLIKFDYVTLRGCICVLVSYLKQFELDQIMRIFENYRPFSSKGSSMKLDSLTIRNLEIFENSLDHQVKGSLLWILDHTATIFGKRQLKLWLSEPLMDLEEIEGRLAAVAELRDNFELDAIKLIKKEMHWTVDLEKGLTSIYYRKVTPEKFIKIVENLEKLRGLFLKYRDEISNLFSSVIVKDIFKDIVERLGCRLSQFLNELNKGEVRKPNKSNLFKNLEKYLELQQCHQKIETIEKSLDIHMKKVIRPALKNWSMVYKTVSNMEYLIEVKNNNLKIIPNDWIKVAGTKQVSRFRTPFSNEKVKELNQTREELDAAANNAWNEYLSNFLSIYSDCREAIQKIALYDCLLSLAVVAKQPGYCKPIFQQGAIHIKKGRHLIIDSLLNVNQQYVANDTDLSRESKLMLISGPNMGGKSSYIKQTALICILAQIGSYVPAESAKLDILDGIYTRMGGSDDIARGKSTFMVELEEASYIMKEATAKSMVIMDELGRGTSTYDGTAIAYATLKYFIEEVKPYTLFVSHYPLLNELEDLTKSSVCNYHMAFMSKDDHNERKEIVNQIDGADEIRKNIYDENDDDQPGSMEKSKYTDEIESIVFLYKLTRGAAKKSYGLNVARLAGLHRSILKKALYKSRELENQVERKTKDIHTLRKLIGDRHSEECNVKEMITDLRKYSGL